jgi:hypothetical protein
MSRTAFKISLTMDRSIILATVIVEFYANPLPTREMSVSNKSDHPLFAMGVFDPRPWREFGHGSGTNIGEASSEVRQRQ